MGRIGRILATAVLPLASFAASGEPAAAPVSSRLRVVFQSDWMPRYRTADLYRISLRGGRRRPLTRNDVDDIHPAWSPDGRMIVFSRDGDLYAMTPKGRDVRRLTGTPIREVDAAWSPDGRWIAFEGGRYGREQIYVMSAEGSRRRRITSDRTCARDPTWARTRIVYLACSGGLTSVAVDGNDRRQIASNPPDELDYQPAVSPDGERLVFTRTLSDLNRTELWIARVDGSGARRLVRDATQAVWSPDGRHIAFVHGPHLRGNEDGYWFYGGPKVSVIDGDGSGVRHLTPQPDYIPGGVGPFPGWRWSQAGIRILGLSWSPDSRSIVYSHRFEQRYPDVATIDRTRIRRVTTNRRIDARPALAPDGNTVAYLSFSRAGGYAPLVVGRLDRRGRRRIAHRAWNAAWSPDRRLIAYDGHDGIHVVDATGARDRRVVTESPNRFVRSPIWSPDGERILYLASRRGGRRTAIFSVRRDGGQTVRIGVLPQTAQDIDWAPDRTMAVFSSGRRLRVMNADGTGTRPLGPRFRRQVALPAWCRDGRTIVFAGREDGDWDLYAMTTRGRVLGKLVDSLADEYAPDC